jgi:hypothetical protein
MNIKKILSICVLLVVAVGVLVWYHIPIKTAATVELYCSDPAGGALDAEFDLSVSRSLFAQDKLDGTIRVGDREYVVWTWQKYGFFESIQRKFEGSMNIPAFVNPDNFGHGVELLLSDILWVNSIQFGSGYEIENVSLQFTSDDYVDGLWSNYTVTA